MRFFIFIFFFFSWQGIIAQETYTPTKIQENEVTLDGILSEKIWKNATKIPVDIEFSPANNLQAKKKTTAYISYSNTFLFIAWGWSPKYTLLKMTKDILENLQAQ